MIHPAEMAIDALLRDCDVQRKRRSGPGGQHRNKVETAIVIEHRPTGVRAEANERRSQEENRQVAVHRLRIHLALAIRCERAGEASPLWQSRCRGGRISVSPTHEDFPALLAEALDAVIAGDFEMAAAAQRLGCSTSQLIKLLQKEPAALAAVNRNRHERGMRPLK